MATTKLLSTLALLAVFMVIADAAQTAKYQCKLDGQTKTIAFVVTDDTNTITELVSGTGDPYCNTAYTEGDSHNMVVTDSVGDDVGSMPCGVTKETNGDYTVVLSTLSGNNLFVTGDLQYTFKCLANPDAFTVTDQVITASGTDVTGSLVTGTATKKQEAVTMAVLDSAGNPLSAAVNLGELISLQVTLTIASGYATGVRLVDCTAKDGPTPTLTANMLGSTGCPAPSLGFTITGFVKAGSSSAASFVTATSQFKAFIFANGGNNVIFSCTAKFCYATDTACDTSCVPPSRRRRRSADDEDDMDVMVYLKVSTDNRTRVSVLPSQGHEGGVCQTKTYVIGLAILGGILFLTLIVSVAFFVLIKRANHGNRSEKHGYENKCVS